MDGSESQFQELLAQLIGRVNRMLDSGQPILPVGLLLLPQGNLDVSAATYDSADQVPSLLDVMRESMAKKAQSLQALASCIAFPTNGSDTIVALLENRDNECLKVQIPVKLGPPPHLDMDGIGIDDGVVQVFPASTV